MSTRHFLIGSLPFPTIISRTLWIKTAGEDEENDAEEEVLVDVDRVVAQDAPVDYWFTNMESVVSLVFFLDSFSLIYSSGLSFPLLLLRIISSSMCFPSTRKPGSRWSPLMLTL